MGIFFLWSGGREKKTRIFEFVWGLISNKGMGYFKCFSYSVLGQPGTFIYYCTIALETRMKCRLELSITDLQVSAECYRLSCVWFKPYIIYKRPAALGYSLCNVRVLGWKMWSKAALHVDSLGMLVCLSSLQVLEGSHWAVSPASTCYSLTSFDWPLCWLVQCTVVRGWLQHSYECSLPRVVTADISCHQWMCAVMRLEGIH